MSIYIHVTTFIGCATCYWMCNICFRQLLDFEWKPVQSIASPNVVAESQPKIIILWWSSWIGDLSQTLKESDIMMILMYYCSINCRRLLLERKLESSGVPKEEQMNFLKELERKETEYIRLKRHKISVDDFELLTIIGRGAFGEVWDSYISLGWKIFHSPGIMFSR